MRKLTENNYPVNMLVEQRWSPRAFGEKPIEKERIYSIMEAARWAPSAYNEQPWRFIVGMKGDDTYEKIMETLVAWNQTWAGKAPVLVLNLAKKMFTRNGKRNVMFKYDLGQAVAFMCLEAVNHGIYTHQMSGFDPERAVELLHIHDDFQAVTVTAFGYYGKAEDLPEDMYKTEVAERERRPLNKTVFFGDFGV
jgi:nitroreductase